MDYERLIDKEHKLSETYVPNDLVAIENTYKKGVKIRRKVYEQWLKLKELLKHQDIHVAVESGYRSYQYQQQILTECIQEKGKEHAYHYVALPGTSEHQSGLAIDYCIEKDGTYIIEFDIPEKISNKIQKEAIQLGFILRYPKEKVEITGYGYEPWHIRYVGEKLATYLYKENKTLDEYELEKE